jgi:hypothetical protein
MAAKPSPARRTFQRATSWVSSEVAELRDDLRSDFREISSDIKADVAETRDDLKADVSGFRNRLGR